MASKSGQPEPEKAEVIEELLDDLDTTLDRVKVLYEQFFLGIQKQPPAYLHTDVERKIRELVQIQIRNTALRYRFVTLQQKFGAYSSYWRRTLRQIESGTYTRSLFKIGRQAIRTGAEVPEEILAAMPRRMREQVIRDREAALALARLRERQRRAGEQPAPAGEHVDVGDLGAEDLARAAFIRESTDAHPGALTAGGAHRIDESDAEFDVDAFFASVTRDASPPSLEALPEAAGPGTALPPSAESTQGARPAHHVPRPPVPSQTRVGYPRPASISGAPAGPDPATTRPSNPGMSAATVRASTGGRPPAAEPSRPQRATGQMRAVIARVKTDPGASTETAPPRQATGQMRAVTPRAKTDPGASTEAAQPRRTTGQMRAVTPRAKTDPGASTEAAQPRRTTGQMHATAPQAGPPRIPPAAGERRTQALPGAPSPVPAHPELPRPSAPAPSQATRPLRVAPGSAAAHAPAPVATLAGPFPRMSSPRSLGASRTAPAAPAAPRPVRSATAPSDDGPLAPSPSSAGDSGQALPPGISNADVNALYAQYVRAKRLLGEEAEPGIYGKLLRTIATQAPKIMQQYKSRGVAFSVVVKGNQVIIRARPKP